MAKKKQQSPPGKKTVFFSGNKLRGMGGLVASFREVFDEVDDPRRADYIVHTNRDSLVGDAMNRYNPRSIAVVTNSLGINKWNGHPEWKVVRICVGSINPALMRPPPSPPAPGRWRELASRYDLPFVETWQTRPDDDDVVLLLPKLGGWLGLSTGQFSARYSRYASDIRARHPNSQIVMRGHPKNNTKHERRVFNHVAKSVANLRVDCSVSVSEEQYARTKLVVCDWSTAVVSFVYRGIPVFNPDKKNPKRMVASGAVGCTQSVESVMDELCENILDTSEPTSELAERIKRAIGI